MARAAVVMGGLFIVCVSLIVGARAIGRSRPAPKSFLDPGDCAQPCWQGLRPGEATQDEIRQRINELDHYALDFIGRNDDVSRNFQLYPLKPLTLGEVIRALGPPERIGCLNTDRDHLRGLPMVILIRSSGLYFADGRIVVYLWPRLNAARLTPEMRAQSVTYYAPDADTHLAGRTIGWRGFSLPGLC